ncbi:hypothetical protein OIDMADRAFT_149790 [Oidiodendron maius Zn]|uniref:Zn(2)-C6 fungal-type domain-containing protein n=1 Tax=Oidiodendron maius (strain Zn) TaxID=913774 RepID=A0A0C3CU19_OIDMZ|nr:hypothetical protein OIDMADRAFT_149790 [Oidiodendron maius Zn]
MAPIMPWKICDMCRDLNIKCHPARNKWPGPKCDPCREYGRLCSAPRNTHDHSEVNEMTFSLQKRRGNSPPNASTESVGGTQYLNTPESQSFSMDVWSIGTKPGQSTKVRARHVALGKNFQPTTKPPDVPGPEREGKAEINNTGKLIVVDTRITKECGETQCEQPESESVSGVVSNKSVGYTDCPPMQSPGSSVFEVEVNGRRLELGPQKLQITVQADTTLGNETTQVDKAKSQADDTIHTPDASNLTAASSPVAAEDFTVEEFRPLPTLHEEQRQQRAEPYDPSVLDAWLKKQSDSVEHSQPTPSELLKSQLWDCIDPREVWPKEHSAEWLADKRKEIEARGGRKANFRRLLTTQVVEERKENGWGAHQNKDTFHDEESKIALTELYGLDQRILKRR